MGRLLRNILYGARQALVLWPEDDYIRPGRDGFAMDREALSKDARQIAYGLRKATKEHGKQVNRADPT